MTQPAPIAVALDAPDLETAARWAGLVTPHVSTVKVGLELYLRYGPEIVASIRGASGVKIFLDLKLHDIPATVAGAARAVARLRPDLLTVHAAGGPEVVRAAVEAAPDTTDRRGHRADLAQPGRPGADRHAWARCRDAVRRLAVLAVEAGARGLVCSPQEVADVRAEVGPDITLITPGIRPAARRAHDQARTATPEEALRAGADLLVIGRPITGAPDPGAAAAAIAAPLRRLAPRVRLTDGPAPQAVSAAARLGARPRLVGSSRAAGSAGAPSAPVPASALRPPDRPRDTAGRSTARAAAGAMPGRAFQRRH